MSTNTALLPPPHLQPPGAGLPPFERFVARLLVGWQARRATRRGNAAQFARERETILALAGTCPAEQAATRVLIPRPRGLEDSSRYWSVYMTLDHLRIVNQGAGELIRLLGRGQTPDRVTGTADVKPSPDADAGVVAAFEAACRHFERCVDEVADLHTALRWPHPWFGPLDAADWQFFTAFHMRLHRHQIEAILRGLRRETPPTGRA